MILRPFFSFFGSKWRLAASYPAPSHSTIVEPFAGSAGYSLRYPERDVILIDRDPVIAGLWRWLIGAAPDDILSLPHLRRGESVDDYDLPEPARWLLGFWIHQQGGTPCRTATAFGETHQFRERTASQLRYIRHWQVIDGDYATAPDVAATWFVDPPYEIAGRLYRYGPSRIDFPSLADWCRARRGQVIVCENAGARWLPFSDLCRHRGITNNGRVRYSREVAYYQQGTRGIDNRKPVAAPGVGPGLLDVRG